MKDTYFHCAPDSPWASRVSSTYVRRNGQLGKYWGPSQAQKVPYFRGSGGIYSTPRDYARFLAAWMDYGVVGELQLLPQKLVVAALTSNPMSLRAGEPRHYARHWEVLGPPRTADAILETGLPIFGHSGSDGTVALASPEQDLIVLYFTQSRRAQGWGEVMQPILGLFE